MWMSNYLIMVSKNGPETRELLKSKLQRERRQFLRTIGAAGLVGLAANSAAAQTNKSETVDPDNYAHSPALPPDEALETFKLAPGYEIELVASEPLVINPIEIKWDAKGRMWIVEMPDYMTTLEGDSSSSESPNARIKVLEDTNGDGTMDKSTVFLDDLSLARAIGFVNEGKLVADETELTFHADTTGDLTSDTQEVLIEDFVNPDNPEHTDNGLQFMMDNWLYNAKSDLRFRFRDGELVKDKTHFRGQWGLTQDNYGRLYYNNNHYWLFADLVPGDYLLRDSFESSHGIGVGLVDDNMIYTIRENYGTNRAYREGYHRDDGRMWSITAACGPGIYRGDLFDEGIVNQAFVPDPAGHVVAQFDIHNMADGLNMEAEHLTYDDEKWEQREFLASTDGVFRPTCATTGPDGALYVVDMYHGIFQHDTYLTDYLRNYILEHNLHKVPPAGRIYRIVPKDGEPNDDVPVLDELEPIELATYLMDDNGWVRDTAQRLIVQQSMTEAVPKLREIAKASDDESNEEVGPVARMHALWALHGLNRIDAESVFSAMEPAHTHLSMAAMRTGEALLNSDHDAEYINKLIDFTKTDHWRIVVQAAYSLGEVSDSELQSQAEDVLNQLLTEYEDIQFITDAANSSLASLSNGENGGGDDGSTIDPNTTVKMDGKVDGWQGVAPSSIEGTVNPPLSLQAGEEYTVEWTNIDGAPHDFVIQDSNENKLIGSGDVTEQGVTTSLTFTASSEMVRYICTFHPVSMVGDISVQASDGGGAEGPPPIGNSDSPPTDPDGDGLYEDIDGDGEVTDADGEMFFEHFESPEIQENPEAFDFNDNGHLDYDDIVEWRKQRDN